MELPAISTAPSSPWSHWPSTKLAPVANSASIHGKQRLEAELLIRNANSSSALSANRKRNRGASSAWAASGCNHNSKRNRALAAKASCNCGPGTEACKRQGKPEAWPGSTPVKTASSGKGWEPGAKQKLKPSAPSCRRTTSASGSGQAALDALPQGFKPRGSSCNNGARSVKRQSS